MYVFVGVDFQLKQLIINTFVDNQNTTSSAERDGVFSFVHKYSWLPNIITPRRLRQAQNQGPTRKSLSRVSTLTPMHGPVGIYPYSIAAKTTD